MSDYKDNIQATDVPVQVSANETPLAVQDLIVDESRDIINEYVSVSITSNGQDTTLSASTIQGEPISYHTTFHGIAADDLQALLGNCGLVPDLG